MRILVPTDFSELSKMALLYSVRIARKLKAEIILLSVIDFNTSAASSLKWQKLEDEMIRVGNENSTRLIAEVKSQVRSRLDISYRCILGYPIESEIEKFAVDNGIDLIVMGTKGASGLKKVLLGSNATAVINTSSRPVILVPGESEFVPVKKIVYASDLTSINDEIMPLAMFARIFEASIRILHVMPSNSTRKPAIGKTVADLVKKTRYSKISLTVSRSNHIADAVDSFVAIQNADLLAVFTHKVDFYEKLLGKSVTRQLAFHAYVPILSFNRTTLQ